VNYPFPWSPERKTREFITGIVEPNPFTGNFRCHLEGHSVAERICQIFGGGWFNLGDTIQVISKRLSQKFVLYRFFNIGKACA
jgi:hypothetical protein